MFFLSEHDLGLGPVWKSAKSRRSLGGHQAVVSMELSYLGGRDSPQPARSDKAKPWEMRNMPILKCDKGHLWCSAARTSSRRRASGTNVPVQSSALMGSLENGGALGQGVSLGSGCLVCNSRAAQDRGV